MPGRSPRTPFSPWTGKAVNGITQLFTVLGQLACLRFPHSSLAALWDGCHDVEPNTTAERSACSVEITGANFGKAYPSAPVTVAAKPESDVSRVSRVNAPVSPALQNARCRPDRLRRRRQSAQPRLPPPPVSAAGRQKNVTPAPVAPTTAPMPPTKPSPLSTPGRSRRGKDMVLALHQQSAIGPRSIA